MNLIGVSRLDGVARAMQSVEFGVTFTLIPILSRFLSR